MRRWKSVIGILRQLRLRVRILDIVKRVVVMIVTREFVWRTLRKRLAGLLAGSGVMTLRVRKLLSVI
jgi:hypothetical protein